MQSILQGKAENRSYTNIQSLSYVLVYWPLGNATAAAGAYKTSILFPHQWSVVRGSEK